MFHKDFFKGVPVSPYINIANAPGSHRGFNNIFNAGFAMKIDIGLKITTDKFRSPGAGAYENDFFQNDSLRRNYALLCARNNSMV
jgi:hypothetical protein